MTNLEYVLKNADKYIADVPDFPKPGIIFKDITPCFEDGEFPHKMIDAMVEVLEDNKIEFNKILCPESRGFLFGVPLGMKTRKGVVLGRKARKLPRGDKSVTFQLEYGYDTLQISKDSIVPGDKVLIVDDLIATGGSAKALADLVEMCDATVAGFIFFIELTPLKGRDLLKDYKVMSLVPVEVYE